jgi:drug/metabolite transporter (DMT)-like permease
MPGVGPYIAFVGLCFIYGTSYAWISGFLKNVQPAVFSFLRMLFALVSTFCIFLYSYNFTPGYQEKIRVQMNDGSISLTKCLFGGIIGIGIPISFVTLSQRTVSSVIITLAQPSIPLFSLVLAHFIVEGERMTFHKVFVHLAALIGALLTMIPTVQVDGGGVSFQLIGFMFLFVGLFFYGLGAIYIKLYMTRGEPAAVFGFSCIGATVYGLVALVWSGQFRGVFDVPFGSLVRIFVFAFFFSTIPSFLFLYVIREIGPVKANLVNFGQIIIGVVTGVFFLNEWKNLKISDELICWIGVIQIFLALTFDFSTDWQAEKRREEELIAQDTSNLTDQQF